MNDSAAIVTAAQEQPNSAAARAGSLTRRMIGIAALWIVLLLLSGGFALDRVLTQSIVANFDRQLDLRAQFAGRGVRNRPRRRSAVQPPARRPALHRALFGRLFPGLRRRRRHLCVAILVGPAAAGRRPTTPTSKPHIYDSRRIRVGAAARGRARRHPSRHRRRAGASRSPNRASASICRSAICGGR